MNTIHAKRWPWDVDIATSAAGLERCMRALINTRSTLDDLMLIPLDATSAGPGVKALLRVHIPEGREDAFRALAKPLVMQPPPLPIPLTTGNRVDKHPGRKETP